MTVIWLPEALDQLADYYVTLSLDAQRRLESTVLRINTRIADNGAFLGESRHAAGRRVWFTGPFAVTFDLILGGGVHVVNIGILRHPTDEP